MDTTAIISIVFFSISELLAIIPIPASGVLHSLVIGIKNSFKAKTPYKDVEMGLVEPNFEVNNLINKLTNNPEIFNIVSKVLNNPNAFAQVNAVVSNSQINYITTLLKDNPQLTSDIKLLIESKLSESIK